MNLCLVPISLLLSQLRADKRKVGGKAEAGNWVSLGGLGVLYTGEEWRDLHLGQPSVTQQALTLKHFCNKQLFFNRHWGSYYKKGEVAVISCHADNSPIWRVITLILSGLGYLRSNPVLCGWKHPRMARTVKADLFNSIFLRTSGKGSCHRAVFSSTVCGTPDAGAPKQQ